MINEKNDQIEVVYKKKLLNKRLSDEANVGFQPQKRRKLDFDDRILSQASDKIDVHVDSETKDLKEETFPSNPAPNDDKTVKVIPSFKKSKPGKQAKPTKIVTKKSIKLKGQTKISTFFSNTKEDTKPNLKNSPAHTAPT